MVHTISLKPGVKIVGLAPEMSVALTIIASLYAAREIPLCITSGLEGVHKEGSLHPLGRALDLRLASHYSGVAADDEVLKQSMKNALGPDFDVVLEKDHHHVELDPQKGASVA